MFCLTEWIIFLFQGTLSKAEWEATSLYLVFAFVKEDTEDAAKDLEKETKEEEKEVEEEEVEEEEETASPTEGEVPDDDADSEGKRKAEIEESISATREIEEDEPPLKKQSTWKKYLCTKVTRNDLLMC